MQATDVGNEREKILSLSAYISAAMFLRQDSKIDIVTVEELLGAASAVVQWGVQLGKQYYQAVRALMPSRLESITEDEQIKMILTCGLEQKQVHLKREIKPQFLNATVVVRALTVWEEQRTVILYTDQIAYLAHLANLRYQLVENLHLAHETFHVWEFEQDKVLSQSISFIPPKRWRKKPIYSAYFSEIGAHAFAWGLVQPSIFPTNLDFLQQALDDQSFISLILSESEQIARLVNTPPVHTYLELYANKIGEL